MNRVEFIKMCGLLGVGLTLLDSCATYKTYFEPWKNIRALGESVDNTIFFAGDAYTDGSDWGSVHAAALSAKSVVEELVREE